MSVTITNNLEQTKTNILSGLTVALALVPEALAFALVAQVSPLTGLYAAAILAFVTSAIGGRPGMISGATGAVAVVMVSLVVQHGAEYLFAAIILMGLLQILFAAAKLGKFIRMVPHPVMLGFVNGLAIVIFLAQLSHFKTSGTHGTVEWMHGAALYTMLGLVALTMAVIYLLPKLTRAIPSALAGILVVSVLVPMLGIHTKMVGDMGSIAGGLPIFHLPNVPLNLETLRIIFPYSLILAAIGLIEALLTLNLIDDITETTGQPNRECMAQGMANIVAGFFATMGGGAMIGQSMININNGAWKRLSGIVAGICLLGFILFGAPLIERIPIAALIGVMFVVAEKTFEWGTFRLVGKVPKRDLLVVLLVTGVTIAFDLAIAVLVGVVVSALVFAWEHAKHIKVRAWIDETGWKVYELEGTLFFASASEFQAFFSAKDDPAEVVIDFRHARVVDHSALEAIDALTARYRSLGKHLHLRHLSPDCLKLLSKARGIIAVKVPENAHA